MLAKLEKETGTLIHYLGGMQTVQLLGKHFWKFLNKLNTELSYDSATPRQKGLETDVQAKTCTQNS